MTIPVILFTDRSSFAERWSTACQAVGLEARTISAHTVAEHLEHGVGAVFDAQSSALDEDELLADVGLARALGAVPVVALEGAPSSIEDVLDELCAGLLARSDQDVARIAAALLRRTDAERSARFEYMSVSPRGNGLLAILGDGTTALLTRPVHAEDDAGEVSAITMAADARSAAIALASGKHFTLTALEVGSIATPAAGETPATLGDVDGVKLGQRLRALRLAAGLTQAELARRTGIHRPNIARVEAGRHTPSLETLARLAAAIGVPTTRVLSGG